MNFPDLFIRVGYSNSKLDLAFDFRQVEYSKRKVSKNMDGLQRVP
jgi:hypothetical protein